MHRLGDEETGSGAEGMIHSPVVPPRPNFHLSPQSPTSFPDVLSSAQWNSGDRVVKLAGGIFVIVDPLELLPSLNRPMVRVLDYDVRHKFVPTPGNPEPDCSVVPVSQRALLAGTNSTASNCDCCSSSMSVYAWCCSRITFDVVDAGDGMHLDIYYPAEVGPKRETMNVVDKTESTIDMDFQTRSCSVRFCIPFCLPLCIPSYSRQLAYTGRHVLKRRDQAIDEQLLVIAHWRQSHSVVDVDTQQTIEKEASSMRMHQEQLRQQEETQRQQEETKRQQREQQEKQKEVEEQQRKDAEEQQRKTAEMVGRRLTYLKRFATPEYVSSKMLWMQLVKNGTIKSVFIKECSEFTRTLYSPDAPASVQALELSDDRVPDFVHFIQSEGFGRIIKTDGDVLLWVRGVHGEAEAPF